MTEYPAVNRETEPPLCNAKERSRNRFVVLPGDTSDVGRLSSKFLNEFHLLMVSSASCFDHNRKEYVMGT